MFSESVPFHRTLDTFFMLYFVFDLPFKAILFFVVVVVVHGITIVTVYVEELGLTENHNGYAIKAAYIRLSLIKLSPYPFQKYMNK